MRRPAPIFIATLFTLGAFCAAPRAHAQAPPSDPAADPAADPAPTAETIVTGFMGPASFGLIGGGAEVAVLRSGRGWAGRVSRLEEFVILAYPLPVLTVWDVALLRVFRSEPDIVVRQIGIGPALTGGMNRGRRTGHTGGLFGNATHEEEPFLTPGLVATASLTIAPFPFLAIGGSTSFNLNAHRTYLAGSLTVSVGGVR